MKKFKFSLVYNLGASENGKFMFSAWCNLMPKLQKFSHFIRQNLKTNFLEELNSYIYI